MDRVVKEALASGNQEDDAILNGLSDDDAPNKLMADGMPVRYAILAESGDVHGVPSLGDGGEGEGAERPVARIVMPAAPAVPEKKPVPPVTAPVAAPAASTPPVMEPVPVVVHALEKTTPVAPAVRNDGKRLVKVLAIVLLLCIVLAALAMVGVKMLMGSGKTETQTPPTTDAGKPTTDAGKPTTPAKPSDNPLLAPIDKTKGVLDQVGKRAGDANLVIDAATTTPKAPVDTTPAKPVKPVEPAKPDARIQSHLEALEVVATWKSSGELRGVSLTAAGSYVRVGSKITTPFGEILLKDGRRLPADATTPAMVELQFEDAAGASYTKRF